MFNRNKKRFDKRTTVMFEVVYNAVRASEKANDGNKTHSKQKVHSVVSESMYISYAGSWAFKPPVNLKQDLNLEYGFYVNEFGKAIKGNHPFIHSADRKALRLILMTLNLDSQALEDVVIDHFRTRIGAIAGGESILELAGKDALIPTDSYNLPVFHGGKLEDTLPSVVKLSDRFWKNGAGSVWITQDTCPEKIAIELQKHGVKPDKIRIFNEDSELKLADKYVIGDQMGGTALSAIMHVYWCRLNPSEDGFWSGKEDEVVTDLQKVLNAISDYIHKRDLHIGLMIPDLTLKTVLKYPSIDREGLLKCVKSMTNEEAYGLSPLSDSTLSEWDEILKPLFEIKNKLEPYFTRDGVDVIEDVSQSAKHFITTKHSQSNFFDNIERGYFGGSYIVTNTGIEDHHHIICFKDDDIQSFVQDLLVNEHSNHDDAGHGIRAPLFVEQDIYSVQTAFLISPSAPTVSIFQKNLFFVDRKGLSAEEAKRALRFGLSHAADFVVKDLTPRTVFDKVILCHDGLMSGWRKLLVLDAI